MGPTDYEVQNGATNMKFIILGPPGTGKGTQAKFLAHHYHLTHLSTGDLFRAAYAKKTKLGMDAASYWLKGNLVPDTLTFQIFEANLPADNFLLDGFPRTIPQAAWLAEKRAIDKVIYIDSSEKETIARLLKRATTEGRKDDTPETIKTRLNVYKQQTAPLLNFYKDKLVRINGDQTVEEVSHEIIRKLA